MNGTNFSGSIAALLNIAPDRVKPETNLRDLVPDSFALVEVVIDLQDRFGVAFNQTDFRGVMTVRDLEQLFLDRAATPQPPTA
jgi:acyl carrier protein